MKNVFCQVTVCCFMEISHCFLDNIILWSTLAQIWFLLNLWKGRLTSASCVRPRSFTDNKYWKRGQSFWNSSNYFMEVNRLLIYSKPLQKSWSIASALHRQWRAADYFTIRNHRIEKHNTIVWISRKPRGFKGKMG